MIVIAPEEWLLVGSLLLWMVSYGVSALVWRNRIQSAALFMAALFICFYVLALTMHRQWKQGAFVLGGVTLISSFVAIGKRLKADAILRIAGIALMIPHLVDVLNLLK